MSKPSLAETHPEIAKEWHPTKNGKLTSYNFTFGSNVKVWWKCDKADDHEWTTSIQARTRGNGCPFCTGRLATKLNCVATLQPQLAKEWHPTKNGNLTPFDVTPYSGKKVWWKCKKVEDHEWESTIHNRSTNGNGCACCNGRKAVLSNCLATLNPEIAKEWHPTKNGKLTSYNFTLGSNVKVWWKCNKGDDHEWKSSIINRAKGNGCPICIGKKVVPSNCLATLNPKLAKEWHPIKNGELTPDNVVPGRGAKVWWKCQMDDSHEWEALITDRENNNSCPFCSSLKLLNPELAKEWHPIKNGELTPYDVASGSTKKVWWKCDKAEDHEWEARIYKRSNGNNCPCCEGLKIVKSNCLASVNPKLASQWHPTKNGDLTPNNVGSGSHKKVWWKCNKAEDHEWTTTVVSRSSGRDCPYCTLTPQSKQELIITFELKTIFKNIDPKGFKTRLDGQLRAIDIFIPLLKLAIEFDGSFWHKDKLALDKIKSEMLMDEGYKVIRIREEPLKKIFDNDIVSIHPYNGKQITDNILKRILELYDLDSKARNKIEVYLQKDSLQNEKGLDRYIDQILTEKAEKSV
jgi:hypothetical protein